MLDSAEQGRQEAQEEANYHGGTMESRYDTFKEEAQYLAGAQTRLIFEFKAAYNQLEHVLRGNVLFDRPHSKVTLASIVIVDDACEKTSAYFISPALGGG